VENGTDRGNFGVKKEKEKENRQEKGESTPREARKEGWNIHINAVSDCKEFYLRIPIGGNAHMGGIV